MILLILNRSFVFGLHNPNMHVLCLAKYLLIESCWKPHYNRSLVGSCSSLLLPFLLIKLEGMR